MADTNFILYVRNWAIKWQSHQSNPWILTLKSDLLPPSRIWRVPAQSKEMVLYQGTKMHEPTHKHSLNIYLLFYPNGFIVICLFVCLISNHTTLKLEHSKALRSHLITVETAAFGIYMKQWLGTNPPRIPARGTSLGQRLWFKMSQIISSCPPNCSSPGKEASLANNHSSSVSAWG